jgi:hypothetical protein
LCLHCFGFEKFHDFLVKFPLNKNLSELNFWISIIKNWNLNGQTSFFAWGDCASVGLRLFKFSYLFYVANNSLTSKNKFNLIKNILLHINYLKKEKNIQFHSNHGLFAIASIILITQFFFL